MPPPQPPEVQGCIVDCLECYSLCRQAAAGCLTEDCAELCRATADLLLRGSPFARSLCALCATVCEACAESLDKSGDFDCVRACRGAARSCRALHTTMPVAP